MVHLRFVVLLAVMLLCACQGDAGMRPIPTGEDPTPIEVEPPIDPAVDAFFRDLRASAGRTLIAGDGVKIKAEGVDFMIAEIERRIPIDGMIPLPKAEQSINALGKTAQEIENAVAHVYTEKYGKPYVTVTVTETAPRYVYVSGEVRAPQRYDIGGTPLTVLQVITLAGGPSDTASMARVRVQRYYPAAGREVSSAPLNLDAVTASGDQTDNILVAPGDTIVVPKAANLKVHMLGHVESPGAINWYAGLTLSKAVTECGGFKKFAKRVEISVVRANGERIEFDFDEFIKGLLPDLMLEPGDRVFVPEKWI